MSRNFKGLPNLKVVQFISRIYMSRNFKGLPNNDGIRPAGHIYMSRNFKGLPNLNVGGDAILDLHE